MVVELITMPVLLVCGLVLAAYLLTEVADES